MLENAGQDGKVENNIEQADEIEGVLQTESVRDITEEKQLTLWRDFIESQVWPLTQRGFDDLAKVLRSAINIINNNNSPDNDLEVDMFRRYQGDAQKILDRMNTDLKKLSADLDQSYGPIAPLMYLFVPHETTTIHRNSVAILDALAITVERREKSESLYAELSEHLRKNLNNLEGEFRVELHNRLLNLIGDRSDDCLNSIDKMAGNINEQGQRLGLSAYLSRKIRLTLVTMPDTIRTSITIEADVENEVEDIKIPRLAIIGQIVHQLGANSIRALGEKGGKITVGAHRASDRLIITVEDDGPGVLDDEKENIFTLGVTSKKREAGGGGLALNRLAVEKILGGSIKELGKYGQGAKFVIDIPLPKQDK